MMDPLGKERLPSIIKDPFAKSHIRTISIWIMKDVYGNAGYKFSADVTFENGDTQGKQEIKGNSFDDLVLKVKALIDNLE